MRLDYEEACGFHQMTPVDRVFAASAAGIVLGGEMLYNEDENDDDEAA